MSHRVFWRVSEYTGETFTLTEGTSHEAETKRALHVFKALTHRGHEDHVSCNAISSAGVWRHLLKKTTAQGEVIGVIYLRLPDKHIATTLSSQYQWQLQHY